jgi:hypothetical protein
VTAFELYAQAKNLLLTSFSSAAKAKLLQAADLLNQAIMHDPSFFEALLPTRPHLWPAFLLWSRSYWHGWRQREAAFQAAFRSVQMQVKRILRTLKIFITGTSTMMAL